MDYNTIISRHLRHAVKDILIRVNQEANPENLQLFITFSTQYPGVQIPERLKKEYPVEMTVVLQYEFENMVVHDNSFSVSLIFDSDMENVSIPLNAIIHLQDPGGDLDLELDPVDIYALPTDEASTPPRTPQKNNGSGTLIDLTKFQEDS